MVGFFFNQAITYENIRIHELNIDLYEGIQIQLSKLSMDKFGESNAA